MLQTLLQIKDVEIVGLATKSKSEFNADHSDLSDLAVANDIPYRFVKDINAPHILEWIKEVNPDVIFCFGWSALIREELLQLTDKGVIGFHPAKLPSNRGRHPIIWALVLGLKETASTFFRMDEGADSGDILHQEDVRIEPSDDALSLYNKITEVAKKQVLEFVPLLAKGQETWQKQDESKANSWRKRGMKDGKIDFRMTSQAIHNLVRGLTKPYVGAHVVYGDVNATVWSIAQGPEVAVNLEPGKILEVDSKRRILVKTGDNSVWLVDHEMETLPSPNEYFA
jgi:methionyl-tRNA formyltransferase